MGVPACSLEDRILCLHTHTHPPTHTHTHSPPGTYAPSAQEHACIFCAPGSATNNLTRATSCSPCEAGRASTNSAGENAGQNGCKICEPGKSSPFGQPKCSECQRGYYASDFGSTSCAPCTAGFFSRIHQPVIIKNLHTASELLCLYK